MKNNLNKSILALPIRMVIFAICAGVTGFVFGLLLCGRSGVFAFNTKACEEIADYEVRKRKNVSIESINYENISGIWKLTDESREKLKALVNSRRKKQVGKIERSFDIDDFTLLIILGGRHFRLYNKDYLTGIVHDWPPPRLDVSYIRGRYNSEAIWSKDKMGNELLDSRDIDYGLDLPVKSIIWAIRKTNNSHDLDNGQGNYVVISEEINPNMWEQNKYTILQRGDECRLARTFTRLGELTNISLEWRKK